MAVGQAFGMLDDTAADSAAMRTSYSIDPDGIIPGDAMLSCTPVRAFSRPRCSVLLACPAASPHGPGCADYRQGLASLRDDVLANT